MKDGKVVEQGTHNELIAQGGEYFALYNVQTQAFLSVQVIHDDKIYGANNIIITLNMHVLQKLCIRRVS